MNRTWLTRMLLSYVPVFLIVSAFLFFIFFRMLSTNNSIAAQKSNDFVAKQAMMVIDSSLAAIDQKVTLEMLRNRTILRYFTQPSIENDLSLQVEVMNELSAIKIANPLIHSVYMVRSQDQLVLNMSTTYHVDQFTDQAFIQERLQEPNSKWSDLRMYKELSSDNESAVVSLTRSVSIFSDKYGLIVVNVNASSLQALVRDMYSPDVTRLHLLDKLNNDMFSLQSGASKEIEGTGAASSRSISEYTGWSIVSSLKGARSIQFFTTLFDAWFVLGVVVCIISLGWIIYVTRRNYRPIHRLVTQLETYTSRGVSEGKQAYEGEFQFINATLESMMDENSRFQQQLQDNLKIKRNFFMYELLEGIRTLPLDNWAAEAETQGAPAEFKKTCIFVMEIDRLAEWIRTYTPQEQDAWKQTLEKLVLFGAESEQYWVWQLWTTPSQMVVMLMGESGQSDEDLRAMILQWHNRVKAELPFGVSIGLGEPIEYPENIRDAYLEALEALQYKSISGGNVLLTPSTVQRHSESGQVYAHFQRVDKIVDLLQLSDSKWRAELRSLMQQFEMAQSSRKDIESVMNYFVFTLNKSIEGMGEEYQKLWRTEVMPALQRTLKEVEMLGDIAHEFLSTLELFETRIAKSRESRNQGQLIMEVKAYIESDFANPALSLDYLSDKFGMSGKYLSRVFKEEFGLKFVDFLIDLRMKEAQTLLAETTIPIQEIAEKLGYSSPISFARTFKKIVGMPPIDYRKEKNSSN
ncbi:helix-turn-helix domain-containing protein [Paenibacillus sp. IITD108]|uniref:helix-turn-helix domain-containing protein n=1 Tax=Paenibacillus sp. IITD108 TaxID=3116649 RepID=UPI002F40E667